MGEKIKNMFRGHKEKKKNQNGGFSYMLASFIIHKRGWIESVFVIGCLLSLLTMNFVNVNYDLTKYLPETAESAIGLDVMRDKFGYPGTARVMVKDVSLYEAKQYKDEIADIDGVDQVLWCDSTVNIYAGDIDSSEYTCGAIAGIDRYIVKGVILSVKDLGKVIVCLGISYLL